ncbi:MAG TPA: type IV pilus twitching motility protein PilT [Armatimonadota bacterium]|jgi:twitching motility protein PilT|nr:type IV pilus twitching motility protein PilT [Armatimonadota bacterium]
MTNKATAAPEAAPLTRFNIDDLLRELVQKEASDLHLRVGEPPVMRVHGDLMRTSYPVLTPNDTEGIARQLLIGERLTRFEEFMEADLSYSLPGVSRFRVNFFRQRGHIGAVMRAIPIKIKTIDDLGLPPVTKELALRPRGLVLVTGPTGSGKSTSLAAMIDHINVNTKKHIITVEDPIEFLHQDKMCAVEQRELGMDTHTFNDALKHVLRQNPDVILVGEMRDLETIALAITAAETGHLVFATLHTTDAPQTVDRVIDVFPPEQQQQIRMQLSVTLLSVISQTLLPRADEKGRIAAFEVMVCTPAIRALIREGKTHQMYTDIQTGGDFGMISLDQYLLDLIKRRLIKYEDALAKSSNPRDFEARAKRMMAEMEAPAQQRRR